MLKIKCGAKHTKGNGCIRCGGFGHILAKYKCSTCKLTYWDAIHAGMTVYQEKHHTAFDGTQLVYDEGFRCMKCFES